MKARVTITLRKGILDPQGQAVANALRGQGFADVVDVRQGKIIEVELKTGADSATAKQQLEEMCKNLLANPVMEDYAVEIVG